MLGRVSERRRQQLMELESRMADLRRQLTEQKKLLKLKEQKEKEAVKMNSEIQVGTEGERSGEDELRRYRLSCQQ